MQALSKSKLVEAEVTVGEGQVVAVDEHHTPPTTR